MNLPDLLRAYDRDCREQLRLGDPAYRVERAGDVVRIVGPTSSAFENSVVWSRLEASTADAAIAAQIRYFESLGRGFEWKHYAHDLPGDLDVRLARAGFRRGESETLLFLAVADAGVERPTSFELRRIGLEGLGAVAALQAKVWGGDFGWLEAGLRREMESDPGGISVYAACLGGEMASTGWIRFGTRFATLHGGATLPAWRGKGAYGALLACRLAEARSRGISYLVTDATEMSRPSLERRGFVAAGRTTPFVWSR